MHSHVKTQRAHHFALMYFAHAKAQTTLHSGSAHRPSRCKKYALWRENRILQSTAESEDLTTHHERRKEEIQAHQHSLQPRNLPPNAGTLCACHTPSRKVYLTTRKMSFLAVWNCSLLCHNRAKRLTWCTLKVFQWHCPMPDTAARMEWQSDDRSCAEDQDVCTGEMRICMSWKPDTFFCLVSNKHKQRIIYPSILQTSPNTEKCTSMQTKMHQSCCPSHILTATRAEHATSTRFIILYWAHVAWQQLTKHQKSHHTVWNSCHIKDSLQSFISYDIMAADLTSGQLTWQQCVWH